MGCNVISHLLQSKRCIKKQPTLGIRYVNLYRSLTMQIVGSFGGFFWFVFICLVFLSNEVPKYHLSVALSPYMALNYSVDRLFSIWISRVSSYIFPCLNYLSF